MEVWGPEEGQRFLDLHKNRAVVDREGLSTPSIGETGRRQEARGSGSTCRSGIRIRFRSSEVRVQEGRRGRSTRSPARPLTIFAPVQPCSLPSHVVTVGGMFMRLLDRAPRADCATVSTGYGVEFPRCRMTDAKPSVRGPAVRQCGFRERGGCHSAAPSGVQPRYRSRLLPTSIGSGKRPALLRRGDFAASSTAASHLGFVPFSSETAEHGTEMDTHAESEEVGVRPDGRGRQPSREADPAGLAFGNEGSCLSVTSPTLSGIHNGATRRKHNDASVAALKVSSTAPGDRRRSVDERAW